MSADQFQYGPEGATPVELYGPENDGWYTTRVHDWIALCPGLRDPDVRGYIILRALVLEKYKNPVRKLTLTVLCELIPGPNGKPSSLTRVRSIITGLSGAGLISTPEGGPVKTSSRAGAAQRPIRIRINDMPAEGYSGWRNAEVKLSYINRMEAEKAAGRNSDPGGDRSSPETDAGRNSDPAGLNSDPRGSNCDPDPGADQPEREVPLVPSFGTATGGDALAARSAGDGRRPSDGSSVREAEGGCAASSKTSPSSPQHDGTDRPARGQKSGSNKTKHTREQLTLVASVRAHFPEHVLTGWTDPQTGEHIDPLPNVPTLSQVILDALAGDVPGADRTVEQLGARIHQRWNHHGWASKFYAGGIDSLVGAAVAMVRPLKSGDRYGCANPRCEAGVDVDTNQECQTCPERLAARTAQRRAQAAESHDDSAASELPEQRVHRPFRDCSCGDPIAKDSDDTMCPRCRRDVDDAEETARLRAQFAAQYGTPEQVDAYCNNAPF